MNYLWELLLKAREQGVDPKTFRFVPAKTYSPYMEISQIDINNEELNPGQAVELNPYYRFYEIFKNLYLPDLTEYEQLRDSLFHLIVHFIAENDLMQGMNRDEYYKKFLRSDLLDKHYGTAVKQLFEMTGKSDRRILLNGILKLYFCGDSLELLKEMVSSLFANTIIYNSNENPYELLIYVGGEKSKEKKTRMELVIQLFANIRYQCHIYYQYHFAILGMDDTSIIDEIAMY